MIQLINIPVYLKNYIDSKKYYYRSLCEPENIFPTVFNYRVSFVIYVLLNLLRVSYWLLIISDHDFCEVVKNAQAMHKLKSAFEQRWNVLWHFTELYQYDRGRRIYFRRLATEKYTFDISPERFLCRNLADPSLK